MAITMKKYSVTEYAKQLGLTRQAILYRIKNKLLPKNVKVSKVGNQYVITEKKQ